MFSSVTRPTLLLDRERVMRNIAFMAGKARDHGLIFRPHFKTHQSQEAGSWFRDFGVHCITVSSVTMAAYFASAGWNDITIAFPVNPRELDRIAELNDRIRLHLLLSHPGMAEAVHRKMNRPVGIFLELDTGDRRSGFDAGKPEIMEKELKNISQHAHLRFAGFLTHAGRTYRARNPEEVLSLHSESLARLAIIREKFLGNRPEAIISLGDTPACSLAKDFAGADEMRPGNFVFYDLMQEQTGACREEQVAVRLACPVVARYPERNEVVVYGGAIHLSKEYLAEENGRIHYGKVSPEKQGLFGPSLPGAFVDRLSQEHGIIRLPENHRDAFPVGSLAGILPVHSCLTADCMKGYVGTDGRRLDHLQGNVYI